MTRRERIPHSEIPSPIAFFFFSPRLQVGVLGLVWSGLVWSGLVWSVCPSVRLSCQTRSCQASQTRSDQVGTALELIVIQRR